MNLSNNNIIVTGSEGLLGKAIIACITQNGGNAICIDIADSSANENYFKCNVTDEAEVNSVFDTIINKYEKIDGLVNCAYPRTGDWGKYFDNESLESWNKNIELQTSNVFLTIKKLAPHFVKNKNGSVVNIASIYGVVGNNFSLYENTTITSPSAYTLIKGGIINFTKYLASFYGKHNIRFNCVSPGGIYNNQNEQFVKNYNSMVPLQRMGTPADIAPSVIFLLSPASAYITGHNLIVDGGWTII
ncbi:MAG: SDR family oxidoreductase [Bacteroidetes bacterium]|nr:SDR family oxidoreductase [Bacteroidota bacterium]